MGALLGSVSEKNIEKVSLKKTKKANPSPKENNIVKSDVSSKNLFTNDFSPNS